MIEGWVELVVTDEAGDIVYASGRPDDTGYLVNPQIVFKAELIDRLGELIGRHEFWNMVGARFKRSMFPGFTDKTDFVFEWRLRRRPRPRPGAQLDFNNDGLVDLVLIAHGGHARVFRNESSPTGNWLSVTLRQEGGNTFALGAQAYVTAGGKTQMAELGAGSSYLSQDDSALHFRLGDTYARLRPASSSERT